MTVYLDYMAIRKMKETRCTEGDLLMMYDFKFMFKFEDNDTKRYFVWRLLGSNINLYRLFPS